jgi:hypothetical protein
MQLRVFVLFGGELLEDYGFRRRWGGMVVGKLI